MNEKRAPKDAPQDFESAHTACPKSRSDISTAIRNTRPPTKLERILQLLILGSLNRFEAEREGDHCLNSTISQIQSLGVLVGRMWESVPGFIGEPVRVRRYYIALDQMCAAERLLERLRSRRR